MVSFRPGTDLPFKCTDILELLVSVKLIEGINIFITKNSKFKILEDDFYVSTETFFPDVPTPKKAVEFKVKLIPLPTAELTLAEDLPIYINWEIEVSMGTKFSGVFAIRYCWFMRDFESEYDINLLFFGIMGSGKTSLLSSLNSLFFRFSSY
jgi:hypothetical protein